jgi:hypothetical protein
VLFYLKNGGTFMQIVNEKGRLFGKVSIIDFFVLILILLVVGFAGYKYISNSNSNPNTEEVTFTVKCTAKNEAYIKFLHVKDNLISSNTKMDAYIEAVSYTPAIVAGNDIDGKPVYSTDPIKKDVIVTIKMKHDPSSPLIKMGVQEISVNNSFTLKTEFANFVGTIESLQLSK